MGKDQKDDANESLSDYGQPLTFEKVWQMFQETDRMFKETGKKFEETDRKIDRLAKLYGGVS